MAANPGPARSRGPFFFAVGLATVLALWLRAWGVTGQVVLDDEWHAIHKLASSTYGDIFTTFGVADHSIPLTLLYKYMANTIGLAEGRLRILQILCGVALVPVCAWVAWGATRDRAVAALFALLVSGAPFLVMWSRFARPYSISLLFTVLAVASIWRWRTERTDVMAACAALTAMLSAWFHPIAGIYPALACLFVFAEDARGTPRPLLPSLRLGVVVAVIMSLPLVAPLYHDFDALRGKSGGDRPDWDTFERMFSIVWGGLPAPAYTIALALSAWGWVTTWRRQAALAAFLTVLAVFPAVFLSINGAVWIYQGQNFLRYQLPLLLLILFLACVGTMNVVRWVAGRHGEGAAWIATLVLAVAYLAMTPAILQVARLGTWYAHLDHHFDYRYRFQDHKRQYPHLDPPDFYRQLGAMPQGTVIEAPFVFEAPYNPLVYYATFHHQREIFGMIHDLCQQGTERMGEVPPDDRRFRFRRFVELGNPAAVRATGARYLIFNRDLPSRFAPLRDMCVAKLTALYGPPKQAGARVVVWELEPAS